LTARRKIKLCYHSRGMARRNLVYYLLLNVFVSACVTSAILYWYDRNYRAVTLPQVNVAASSAPASSGAGAPTATHASVQIVSVIGAGVLDVEAVVLQYSGEGELDLTGWHLKDQAGHSFTFPPFKLFKDGAVQIHTAGGTNTAIDLYWGEGEAVWQSGQSVLLTTPEGQAQDSYPVP
jgi:Lamin Tail Domain